MATFIQGISYQRAPNAVSRTNPIVAVVVTFNPDAALAQRLSIIHAQVGVLVIVDNGSSNQTFVRDLAKRLNCRIELNQQNVGVATALNQAARIASSLDAEWLAMFDQDSEAPVGAISALLQLYETFRHATPVAILAMSHRDRGTGRDYHLPTDILGETSDTRTVRTTITSGSMVRLDAYRALGGFDERLFIDSVDLEYCLRARRHGYLVVEARHIVLNHSVGNAERKSLAGRPVTLTHHVATRRYYITRNQLRVAARYFWFDPVWSVNALVHLAGFNVAALVFEDGRREKLWAMLCGVRDFLLAKDGPRS